MGTNVIVGTDPEKIVTAATAALNGSSSNRVNQLPLWDGHAAERILDVFEDVTQYS